jgi:hypothetical protein
MAWQTDQPPLEYLKRRVIYYKKKRGYSRKWIKDKGMIKRYGKKAIQTAIDRIESRIKEFEQAAKILSENLTK